MKKILQITALSAVLIVPLFAAAQAGPNTTYITQYSNGIIGVINGILVPVLMAIAFIVFLWGVYKYFILGAADETSRTDGRKFTLWGIIGFVVILSLWGIVNLVMSTLGLTVGTVAPTPPKFNPGGTAAQYNPGGYTGGSGTPPGPNGSCPPGKVYDVDTATCMNSIIPAGGGSETYFTCSDGSTAFDIMSCPPPSGTCVDELTGESYPC